MSAGSLEVHLRLTVSIHFRQPLRHQMSLVTDVPDSPIKPNRRIVSVRNLEMNRVDAQFSRGHFDEFHRLPANSPPSILFRNIQLIDKRIVSTIFEAERISQYYIPHIFFVADDQPRFAIGAIAHKAVEYRTSLRLVESALGSGSASSSPRIMPRTMSTCSAFASSNRTPLPSFCPGVA